MTSPRTAAGIEGGQGTATAVPARVHAKENGESDTVEVEVRTTDGRVIVYEVKRASRATSKSTAEHHAKET